VSWVGFENIRITEYSRNENVYATAIPRTGASKRFKALFRIIADALGLNRREWGKLGFSSKIFRICLFLLPEFDEDDADCYGEYSNPVLFYEDFAKE
jgi:hypothetical protein